ncbi:MAG TPA: hypothetical protein VGO03_19415 [Acidimicrobiia bacterium]|jgi:hypothetical protein
MTARGVGERGAALVLALVLVTAVVLIGVAAFEMGDETFRADGAAQSARAEAYAAGGALDVLVNAMRNDPSWGRDGTPCAGLSLAVDDGALVEASCTPLSGSGALLAGGAGARADRVVELVATIAGRRVARERVDFVDAAGSAPGAVVRVRDWTVSA